MENDNCILEPAIVSGLSHFYYLMLLELEYYVVQWILVYSTKIEFYGSIFIARSSALSPGAGLNLMNLLDQ